jgi:hypothetical protein
MMVIGDDKMYNVIDACSTYHGVRYAMPVIMIRMLG